MVAGSGVDTEFCYWSWTTPPGSKDPDSWGDATECASSDGTFALLDDYRGAGTAATWSVGAPANYSNTELGVVIYSGSGAWEVEDWAHGDVQ